MSSQKKVLIVSLGSIGKRHLRNTRELLPDATIGIFKQFNKEKISVPAGADHVFYSLEEAINFRPDSVIISSPATDHLKNAEVFAKLGAHLFIEKPMAATSAENKAFSEMAKKTNSFLMIGYVLRFLPLLTYIKNFLADDKLGTVRTAHVEVGQYLPDWRPTTDYRLGVSAQAALGGGALLELSHEIDYALWLFGLPQKLICSKSKLSDLEIDVEDSVHIILEYGQKTVSKKVLLQLDFLQRVPNMRVEVVGSKGTLVADLCNEKLFLFDPENPTGKQLEAPTLATGNEIYLKQFDFFFSKSFADYKPIFTQSSGFSDWVSIDMASQVLTLIDTARKSDETGTRQEIHYES